MRNTYKAHALLLLLCGLASGMYSSREEREESFRFHGRPFGS